MSKGDVSHAVGAFEEQERVQFLLDRKEQASRRAVVIMATDAEPGDLERYYTETEEIRRKYEEKRREAGL